MTRAETIREAVAHATPDELPMLAGELANALAAVLSRAAAPVAAARPESPLARPDILLTVEEAAARLGVARSWLYRHARQLPFTRKISHRVLRFDRAALEHWAESRVPVKVARRP